MVRACIGEVVVAAMWDEMRRMKLRRCACLSYRVWLIQVLAMLVHPIQVWAMLMHTIQVWAMLRHPIRVSLRLALRVSVRQREVRRGAGRDPKMDPKRVLGGETLSAPRSRSVGRRRGAERSCV